MVIHKYMCMYTLYCNFFIQLKLVEDVANVRAVNLKIVASAHSALIDMPRFGGPGLKKKACIHRKCRHKVSALQLTQA